MNRINIAHLAGAPVLAGAINGKNVFGALVLALPSEPPRPEPLFIDFGSVEAATSSFMREAILAFRDFVRRRGSNFYPVVANANVDVLDELEEMTRRRGDVLVACELDKRGRLTSSFLIGELDPKQKITVDLVRSYGEVDARKLMEEHGTSEQVKSPTAWNNRLASLVASGVLVELRDGRSKRYRLLLEG